MCEVLDKSGSGLIDIQIGEIDRFQNRYGITVGGKSYAKNKK